MQKRKTHELKTWPEYFAAVVEGWKTFELRKDDRGFEIGDNLSLKEFDPEAQEYTGFSVLYEITYILRGTEHLAPGYCALGIKPVVSFGPVGLEKYRRFHDGLKQLRAEGVV